MIWVMLVESWGWPQSDDGLVELQYRLARAAAASLPAEPWLRSVREAAVVGACFVVYARGEPGPGRLGDRAWAAAVTWLADASAGDHPRRGDHHLRGARGAGRPRRADDVLAQAVVADRVASAYRPGLLARREGPLLAAAVAALGERPEVLLVDASGIDHPRRAGLAVHLGAVSGLPTVGVTRRPLVASGAAPELRRGAISPLDLDGRCVGYWVCTRTGARALVAHAGWQTSPEGAAQIVLATSTPAARTPVPLQEARRVAREARALAGAS
jgi:deoxyribonuclease V